MQSGALVFVLSAVLASACARFGPLAEGYGHALAADGLTGRTAPGGVVGPHPVRAEGTWAGDLPVVVYRPADVQGPAPAVVFLPGRVAPEAQYESYGRALASHGIVVASRGWYGPFYTDRKLARDATRIADWLVGKGLADPSRLGVAGHSMGGKDAILAALNDPRFRAVVALDPDDNGRRTVAHGPVGALRAHLLLVGAEVAWQASRVCAPRENNYQRFFEHAPPGTVELTLREADHVQLMDDPDGFGMGICRCGSANSQAVRTLARLATVRFFGQWLAGEAPVDLALGEAGTLRVRAGTPARAVAVGRTMAGSATSGRSAAGHATSGRRADAHVAVGHAMARSQARAVPGRAAAAAVDAAATGRR